MTTQKSLLAAIVLGPTLLIETSIVFAQQVAPTTPVPATVAAAAPAVRGGFAATAGMTSLQSSALAAINATLSNFTQAATAARSALLTATFTLPVNPADLQAKVAALRAAENALALARADAFIPLQSTVNRLTPYQVSLLAANDGAPRGGGNGRQADPMNFNDHDGYISIFDGKTLDGWDGHPKFWRVENGALVGESTTNNPSGNQYITYRDIQAHDLDLKLEIKLEGRVGSGVQYRSVTGVPWRRNVPANVLANAGPLNNNWMSTGPQADFWPTTSNTGQFYTENDALGIQARRGQMVEGFASTDTRKLVGVIGDSAALQGLIKMEDWNQYMIVARGPMHVLLINGQVMAVQVDDDPLSVNNQAGYVAIELESVGKVSVRNIWLKKIN